MLGAQKNTKHLRVVKLTFEILDQLPKAFCFFEGRELITIKISPQFFSFKIFLFLNLVIEVLVELFGLPLLPWLREAYRQKGLNFANHYSQ